MNEFCPEVCTRCLIKADNEESDLLEELAYDEDRYLPDLLKKAQEEPDSAIHEEAVKQMEQRLELEAEGDERDEDDEDILGPFETDSEEFDPDAHGVPRTEAITEEDVRRALEEYESAGLIEIQGGKVIVTSKGVKRLADDALRRILESLQRKNTGSHAIEKEDVGVELSLHTRRYEVGDAYASVDIVKTALNALNRCGELKLDPADFEVHEEIHETKLCAAILIDESGSMRDSGKLEAAMETALALSKLIMREPENSLKVFTFSDKVRQINPWEIVNEVISGGDTDIKSALASFRRITRHEYGDKQAYLITDTEPNNEDGTHISFEKASNGLIEEASRYRAENIGLNIIMLDDSAECKELASTLAKKNLGRVFFTTPETLGEVLIEDYLKGSRDKTLSRTD
ncbi:VWA domain-containing protein [Chloroflexota bacterium]